MPKESQEVIKEKIKKVADGIINNVYYDNIGNYYLINSDIIKSLSVTATGKSTKQVSYSYTNLWDFIIRNQDAFNIFGIEAAGGAAIKYNGKHLYPGTK